MFEKEKKFLEVQQTKLNEIVKSLHNLFVNKKEEKKTYGEMSSIFANLGNKNILFIQLHVYYHFLFDFSGLIFFNFVYKAMDMLLINELFVII